MHKHHTHCSVESVAERGAAAPSPSLMRELVDGPSKPEQRTCAAQGIEDRGHFSRWPEAGSSETSTAQYIIHNIKTWGCLKARVVLRKRLSSTCPGASSSPPPPPQEKNHQHTRKCFPINLASPVRPRDRSHRQAPIRESSASDPCKGFPPKTSKRPRVDAIKNAHLEPSCHCAGTATGSFQHPPQKERNRDVCPRNGPGLSVYWPQSGG